MWSTVHHTCRAEALEQNKLLLYQRIWMGTKISDMNAHLFFFFLFFIFFSLANNGPISNINMGLGSPYLSQAAAVSAPLHTRSGSPLDDPVRSPQWVRVHCTTHRWREGRLVGWLVGWFSHRGRRNDSDAYPAAVSLLAPLLETSTYELWWPW